MLFLQAQAAAAAPAEEDRDLPTAKDVSAAYCSIAEIYLTDLWYQSTQSCTSDTCKPISCLVFF